MLNNEQQRVLLGFGGWRNAFAHGTGDKKIKDVGTNFLKPIDEVLTVTVGVLHDIEAFNRHSLERQKFMAFASMIVASFHDLILDLQARRQPHSDDATPQ